MLRSPSPRYALPAVACSRAVVFGAGAAILAAGAAILGGGGGEAHAEVAAAAERSRRSGEVQALLQGLQRSFVARLGAIQPQSGEGAARDGFAPVKWQRGGGALGGGRRYEQLQGAVFDRASVNVSAVHYESVTRSPVNSATALSVILHPAHPYAPSMHFHISYIEPKGKPPVCLSARSPCKIAVANRRLTNGSFFAAVLADDRGPQPGARRHLRGRRRLPCGVPPRHGRCAGPDAAAAGGRPGLRRAPGPTRGASELWI